MQAIERLFTTPAEDELELKELDSGSVESARKSSKITRNLMLEFHAILSVSLKRILGCFAYSHRQVGD